jgi:hypothetical protein
LKAHRHRMLLEAVALLAMLLVVAAAAAFGYLLGTS